MHLHLLNCEQYAVIRIKNNIIIIIIMIVDNDTDKSEILPKIMLSSYRGGGAL